MALKASASRPTSSLRTGADAPRQIAAGDGFGRRRQIGQRRRDAPADDPGEQRAQHDEQRADRQHRVPEGGAPGRARPIPASRPREPAACSPPAPRCPATSIRRPAGTSRLRPTPAAGGASTRVPRSVQIPLERDPRSIALPAPIRRATDWPAAGDAARRRNTRKPRWAGLVAVGAAFTSATCSV